MKNSCLSLKKYSSSYNLRQEVSRSNDLKNNSNNLDSSSSHIFDNLIPEVRKMEGKEDEEESITNKTCQKKFSDFFQEARVQKFSIKTPHCCKISKGLIMGIVFLLFFSMIILWIVFSTENFETDEKVLQSFNKKRCNSSANCTNGSYQSGWKKSFWSNNFFILFTTILIVAIIVGFVFVSASCKYIYQKKKYPEASQSVFASIFGEQNKRDSLFYLEQNEKMHMEKFNESNENNVYAFNENDHYSKANFFLKYFDSNLDNAKNVNIPIIVVNDPNE